MVGTLLGEEEPSRRLRDPGRHEEGRRVLLPGGCILERGLRGVLREGQLVSAATPSLRSGGKNQLGRGRQEFASRSATRGPVGLTEVCVEAVLRVLSNPLGPLPPRMVILGYKRVQGGF